MELCLENVMLFAYIYQINKTLRVLIVEISTIRQLKIREKSKLGIIEKFEKISNSKINAIANYEEKSKTIFFK